MKKLLKILLILFIAVNVYSLIPVISLYFEKAPKSWKTNESAVDSLKNNKGTNFSFLVTSDTGAGFFMNESATLKIISRMNKEGRFKKAPIDLVLNVGDVTFRGRESHFKNYAKLKDKIKYPVIDAAGNHDDDHENTLRLFNKYCGKEDLSFVDRNSYFIVLDNKGGDLSEDKFLYFEKELQKGSAHEHTFVFLHKPPFNPFSESWYRAEGNAWSGRFMELCDKYGVDIVFSGHEEGHRVAKFGSVTYIVTSGGGTLLIQPASKGGFLNYVLVRVNGKYVDHEVKKVAPPAWEFFAYYMWKELVYFMQGLLN